MVLPNGQFRFMFTARDYPAAVAFYRDDLGLPLDHDWDYGPGDAGSVFHAGPALVEIFSPAPGADVPVPQGVSMLLQVEDVDAFYRRAQQRGLKVLLEPTSFPWGQRVLRLQDPDGITVALFTPLSA